MISRNQWQDQWGMGEGGVEDKGEVEEVSEEVGRGRKKGKEGAKRKKTNDDDDGTQKIPKGKSTPKKWQTSNIQKDSTLNVSPGPSHNLIRDDKVTKARSKKGKRKVKKVGLEGILEPVHQISSTGARYYTCPYEPCEETVVSIEGMRSHIKQVHTLYSYFCAYCLFTTKNFDSLKSHEKGCKGA